jgi:hypothetical protein
LTAGTLSLRRIGARLDVTMQAEGAQPVHHDLQRCQF